MSEDDQDPARSDEVVRGVHDWAGRGNIETDVVLTVAAAADVDPLDLPTLNDSVDPDALNRLLDTAGAGSHEFRGEVSFPYAGHEVTVRSSGTIRVEPLDDADG